MWAYEDTRAAMRDVLRLSRAMTYKAAVADLPLGGGKGVIVLRPGQPLSPGRRRDVLLDFGDTVDALGGRYITAEDVGISSRDIEVVSKRTRHVSGLPPRKGGSGDPSPATALGVEAAIRVTCERAFGSDSLRGRSVAVIGLGHVGSRLAARCARGGAKLVVSDVDPDKRAVAERLGARWVAPDQALLSAVDVLAPCALGGVFDDQSIPRLRCAAVAGAANNQLADDTAAEALQARGILWAPDFVANAGGIINISVELNGRYDRRVANKRVRGIADTLRSIFDHSERAGVTPLTAAMELARRRIAEASAGDRRPGAD